MLISRINAVGLLPLALSLQAEEAPQELPDPAAAAEDSVRIMPIEMGRPNELFIGADIDRRINGMLSRLDGQSVTITPPVQKILVQAPGGH